MSWERLGLAGASVCAVITRTAVALMFSVPEATSADAVAHELMDMQPSAVSSQGGALSSGVVQWSQDASSANGAF